MTKLQAHVIGEPAVHAGEHVVSGEVPGQRRELLRRKVETRPGPIDQSGGDHFSLALAQTIHVARPVPAPGLELPQRLFPRRAPQESRFQIPCLEGGLDLGSARASLTGILPHDCEHCLGVVDLRFGNPGVAFETLQDGLGGRAAAQPFHSAAFEWRLEEADLLAGLWRVHGCALRGRGRGPPDEIALMVAL